MPKVGTTELRPYANLSNGLTRPALGRPGNSIGGRSPQFSRPETRLEVSIRSPPYRGREKVSTP